MSNIVAYFVSHFRFSSCKPGEVHSSDGSGSSSSELEATPSPAPHQAQDQDIQIKPENTQPVPRDPTEIGN